MATLLPELAKLAPRFRQVRTGILARREFEAQSRAAISAFQLSRFNDLWLFAVKTVPYYRRLVRKLDLPERFSSIEVMTRLVPTLEKTVVQDDPLQFLSEK